VENIFFIRSNKVLRVPLLEIKEQVLLKLSIPSGKRNKEEQNELAPIISTSS
jgi:hypothetical protein